MPVIRYPNFSDKTWDVEMDKLPLIIGNHVKKEGLEKSELSTISLKDYLKEIHKYMSAPPFNKPMNLLVTDPNAKQKDTHVIMSSQCCFLPIEKGKETKFNIALYNYQSSKDNPAVLVIVSTSKGTSAQIIEGKTQKLFFNNKGRVADFMGQRLTDNRRERGVKLEGAMSKKEKQENVIVIIQVPLKVKRKERSYEASFGFGGGGGFLQLPSHLPNGSIHKGSFLLYLPLPKPLFRYPNG